MIKLPLPKTQAEKELELYILKEIMRRIEHDMPMQEILNVLERVRHLSTEIALEIME
jgi:hypothetical protein